MAERLCRWFLAAVKRHGRRPSSAEVEAQFTRLRINLQQQTSAEAANSRAPCGVLPLRPGALVGTDVGVLQGPFLSPTTGGAPPSASSSHRCVKHEEVHEDLRIPSALGANMFGTARIPAGPLVVSQWPHSFRQMDCATAAHVAALASQKLPLIPQLQKDLSPQPQFVRGVFAMTPAPLVPNTVCLYSPGVSGTGRAIPSAIDGEATALPAAPSLVAAPALPAAPSLPKAGEASAVHVTQKWQLPSSDVAVAHATGGMKPKDSAPMVKYAPVDYGQSGCGMLSRASSYNMYCDNPVMGSPTVSVKASEQQTNKTGAEVFQSQQYQLHVPGTFGPFPHEAQVESIREGSGSSDSRAACDPVSLQGHSQNMPVSLEAVPQTFSVSQRPPPLLPPVLVRQDAVTEWPALRAYGGTACDLGNVAVATPTEHVPSTAAVTPVPIPTTTAPTGNCRSPVDYKG